VPNYIRSHVHWSNLDREQGEIAPGQPAAAGAGGLLSLSWFGHACLSSISALPRWQTS